MNMRQASGVPRQPAGAERPGNLEADGPGEARSLCATLSSDEGHERIRKHGASRPLAAEASVVILDMSLDSGAVVMGTAAEELLGMAASSVDSGTSL